MAKAAKKKDGTTPVSRAPEVQFTSAVLGGGSSQRATARRFGEKTDDLKSPAGSPRDYEYADIVAVAEDAAKVRVDDRQSWFFDRVREMCGQRRPRIKVPDDNRTMARIIGPIYKRAKLLSR
jgi:hypothetical protein